MGESLRTVTQFDATAWLLFSRALVQHRLNKNELLLYPGQVCNHIYFLETGLLRSFYVKEGDERNVAFGLENTFLTDLKSLRTEQPTELTIQALEPSVLLSIAKADITGLYRESHQIEAFGRNLLEMLLEEQEEYAGWFKLYSAEERYDLLCRKHPSLQQRLPLGQIASFLGIRRETLSRIRRRK